MNRKQRITGTLLRALPHESHPELKRFLHILREYPSREGKAFRGLLVLEAAATFGAPLGDAAYTVAAAIELFQNWALVHDDIADESGARRGKPSLHLQFGVPLALNAGDALHGVMWDMLLNLPHPSRDTVHEIMREFSRITWTTASGQHLDLVWAERPEFAISESDYLEVVRRKTAYYTVVGPLRLGALLANEAVPAGLSEAAEDLGVAFQLHDDLLDLRSEAETGKPVGGDLYESKRTLLLSYALQHASADDRVAAEAILVKPRAEKTREDIDRLLHLIQASGAETYTAALANDYATRGLAGITEALAGYNPERVEPLLSVLTNVTKRSA